MNQLLMFLALLTACYQDTDTVVTDLCSVLGLENGRVIGMQRIGPLTFKCNKNFEIIGAKVVACQEGIWSSDPPICASLTCPLPEVADGVIVQKMHKGGSLSVTCGTGLKRAGVQMMICHNGNWTNAPPNCSSILSLECDFEQDDLCGWSQDISDDFDWRWNQGNTPTAGTGPQFDHTLKSPSGHYLFIESSRPQKPGYEARLLSPAYINGSVDGMCLEFFYHMFGPNETRAVGDLDVFIHPVNSDVDVFSTVQHIFHRGGNQGDSWVLADVYIPKQTTAFQLVFQATRQDTWYSDIAIDDLRIHNCSQSDQRILTDISETTEQLNQKTPSKLSSSTAPPTIISPRKSTNNDNNNSTLSSENGDKTVNNVTQSLDTSAQEYSHTTVFPAITGAYSAPTTTFLAQLKTTSVSFLVEHKTQNIYTSTMLRKLENPMMSGERSYIPNTRDSSVTPTETIMHITNMKENVTTPTETVTNLSKIEQNSIKAAETKPYMADIKKHETTAAEMITSEKTAAEMKTSRPKKGNIPKTTIKTKYISKIGENSTIPTGMMRNATKLEENSTTEMEKIRWLPKVEENPMKATETIIYVPEVRQNSTTATGAERYMLNAENNLAVARETRYESAIQDNVTVGSNRRKSIFNSRENSTKVTETIAQIFSGGESSLPTVENYPTDMDRIKINISVHMNPHMKPNIAEKNKITAKISLPSLTSAFPNRKKILSNHIYGHTMVNDSTELLSTDVATAKSTVPLTYPLAEEKMLSITTSHLPARITTAVMKQDVKSTVASTHSEKNIVSSSSLTHDGTTVNTGKLLSAEVDMFNRSISDTDNEIIRKNVSENVDDLLIKKLVPDYNQIKPNNITNQTLFSNETNDMVRTNFLKNEIKVSGNKIINTNKDAFIKAKQRFTLILIASVIALFALLIFMWQWVKQKLQCSEIKINCKLENRHKLTKMNTSV